MPSSACHERWRAGTQGANGMKSSERAAPLGAADTADTISRTPRRPAGPGSVAGAGAAPARVGQDDTRADDVPGAIGLDEGLAQGRARWRARNRGRDLAEPAAGQVDGPGLGC